MQRFRLVFLQIEIEFVDVFRMFNFLRSQGIEEPLSAELRPYLFPRLSPDGSKVIVPAVNLDKDDYASYLQVYLEIQNTETRDRLELIFCSSGIRPSGMGMGLRQAPSLVLPTE